MERKDMHRSALRKGSIISLTKKNGQTAKFKITGVVGYGGSSICYYAACEDKRGRLKEFYPADVSMMSYDWFFFLNRGKDNQLYPSGEPMTSKFIELRDNFANAYITLEQTKRKNKNNEVLNNYIPAFELYYGKDINLNSIYIWTPDDKKGKSYEEYLAEVHKYPEKNAAQTLYDILNAMISLTDCICAIHKAGLLHLDIKPSNFLVLYDSALKVNTRNISLFDINTLYPMESDFPKLSGTDGFRAPEVECNRADNRSDIYSIGCVLFTSIILFGDKKPIYYNDAMMNNICNCIESSLIFTNSEINGNVYLKHLMVSILKKTLAKRAVNRYASCEELKEDLKRAKAFLLPETEKKRIGSDKKLLLVDAQKNEKCNSTAVIQNLLFNNTLYDWIPEWSSNINVLVFGCGTYSQKFIDACLQAGQVIDKKLTITVLSNEIEADSETYLQFRPALTEFVEVYINGKPMSSDAKNKEMYAVLNFNSLSFEGAEFDGKKLGNGGELVKQKLTDIVKKNQCQYIFISMGDDLINQGMAKNLVDISKQSSIEYSVNFVWTGKQIKFRKGNPVFVNAALSEKAIHPDLERMAFNVYLSWNTSAQKDTPALYQRFREKYNYRNSIDFALSIKYKLQSVGIGLSDLKYAAKEFYDKFNSSDADKALYRKLIAAEHRRWVLNKIVNGWTPPPKDKNGKVNYTMCISKGSVKDIDKKLHPCIVRSTDKMPLSDAKYKKNNHAMWEGHIDGALDDLDRLSIEIHQCFKAYTERLKKQEPLLQGDVHILGQMVYGNAQLELMYNRFVFCLRNILNENRSYAEQYDYYEKQFIDALHSSDVAEKDDIISRIKHIRRMFFPVVESCLFRDYKAYDERIVKRIPFILTYDTKMYIAMAFEDGVREKSRSEIVFKNIASAAALCPYKVTYMYYLNAETHIDLFFETVRSVVNYSRNAGLSAKFCFLTACDGSISDEMKKRFADKMNELSENSIIYEYCMFDVASEEDAIVQWQRKLLKRKVDYIDGSTLPFKTHIANSKYTMKMIDLKPYFEFDRKNKQIVNSVDSEHLAYIERNSFIRVDDMFALSNARDNKYNLPEFAEDYEFFWDIYTGKYLNGNNAYRYGITNWTKLCNELEKYVSENDRLCNIKLVNEDRIKKTKLVYYIPGYCYKTAKMLVNKLIQQGAVDNESTIRNYTSDTCKLEVFTEWNIADKLDNLFADASILVNPDSLMVSVYYIGNIKNIFISFNSLKICGLNLTDNNCYKVLEKLSEGHYITKLTKADNKVSFCFSSNRIKKLLTQAGEILEIYTYYECCKVGYFDDIVSGYEFRWGDSNVINEMDCILTKGFKSVFVECKSRKMLEQDFYHKLLSVAEQFGVGAKKVLIANTYDHAEMFDSNNNMQKQRGDMMDIITISDPEEIQNIGITLKKIMQDKY